MSRLLQLVFVLAFLWAVVSAKEKQLDGKKVFGELFQKCKVPRADRALLREFRKPSPEYQACFTIEIYRAFGLVKEDGTLDIAKFARQFTDYGYEVPAELYDAAGLQVEKDIDLFVEKMYPFVKAHETAVKGAFYGNPVEKFTSVGFTFEN